MRAAPPCSLSMSTTTSCTLRPSACARAVWSQSGHRCHADFSLGCLALAPRHAEQGPSPALACICMYMSTLRPAACAQAVCTWMQSTPALASLPSRLANSMARQVLLHVSANHHSLRAELRSMRTGSLRNCCHATISFGGLALRRTCWKWPHPALGLQPSSPSHLHCDADGVCHGQRMCTRAHTQRVPCATLTPDPWPIDAGAAAGAARPPCWRRS